MPILWLIIAVSYLLGSIPFGYVLVRIVRGEDVRQSGSGNIGATNVSRTSPALGVLTLVLDACKGAAAVMLAAYFAARMHAPSTSLSMSLAALFATLGHMFPIWLKFRGGKGVATALGSFVVIAPKAVLVAGAAFAVTVSLFRYVSLGSILAVLAFPFLVVIFHEYDNRWLALGCMSLVSLFIIGKHQANIRRLLHGTENRLGSKRFTGTRQ